MQSSSRDKKEEKMSDASYKRLQYNYGNYFRQKRKSKKATAIEAADIIGCSTRTLRRLEANYDVSLKFSTFVKMAEYYGFRLSIINAESNGIDSKIDTDKDDSEMQMKIISAIEKMPYKEFTVISELANYLANIKKDKPVKNETKVSAIKNITVLNHTQLVFLYKIMNFLSDNPEAMESSK